VKVVRFNVNEVATRWFALKEVLAMSSSALVIGIMVAFFIVIAIALIVKSQHSQRLKARFGPEYNRAVH
jgi:hypothetical protein